MSTSSLAAGTAKTPLRIQILLSECHARLRQVSDQSYRHVFSPFCFFLPSELGPTCQDITPPDLAALSIGRGVTGGAYHITQQSFRHLTLVIAMTTRPQETPDLGQEIRPHCSYRWQNYGYRDLATRHQHTLLVKRATDLVFPRIFEAKR